MKWTTELPFVLDGVDGDLRIVYNPLSQKFYQNGQELRKSGSGFGGLKYKVRTTDGGEDIVTVKGGLIHGRQVVFRGMTTNLEKTLDGLSLLLSAMPFIFIVFAIFVLAGGRFGVIDAALMGGCGALGMLAIGNAVRNATDFGTKIIYSLILSVAATAVFFVLALIFGLIFAAIFGAAFSLL